MKLEIERPYVEAIIANFPGLAPLEDQLRFGDKVEVALSQLSDAELGFLQELYGKGGPEMRLRAAQIATLKRALADKSEIFTADDLEAFLPAISRYLIADAIRGWMFTASVTSRALPYVVTRLDYTPPANDETGRIFTELKANAKGMLQTSTVRISAGDIAGKTVSEVFTAKGFLKETPELICAYTRRWSGILPGGLNMARNSRVRVWVFTPKIRTLPTATRIGRARTWWCSPQAGARRAWSMTKAF